MIQISFQPALDPLHATFRLLRLRDGIMSDKRALPWHTLRIADFYLCFPYRIASIRLQPKDRGIKKIGAEYEQTKGYAKLPDDFSLFTRMQPLQTAALEYLVKGGFFQKIEERDDEIQNTGQPIPAALQSRVTQINTEEEDLLRALDALTRNYDLLGANGLKDRTRLMDYRYDA